MNTNLKIDFEMSRKKTHLTGFILYVDWLEAETHKQFSDVLPFSFSFCLLSGWAFFWGQFLLF